MSFPFARLAAGAIVAGCAGLVGCGGHSSSKPGAPLVAAVRSATTSATTSGVSSGSAPVSSSTLELVLSDPADGATRVPSDQVVRLTFAEPLDDQTLAGISAETSGVPIAIGVVTSGVEVELRAQPAWPDGPVTLRITPRLRSASGLAARPRALGFTCHAGPAPAQALALPGGARAASAVVQLGEGPLLITGGEVAAPSSAVDLYDPATGELSAAAPLAQARAGHSATRLADGRVLVVGGRGAEQSLELYEGGAWRTLTARLRRGRSGHQAFRLPSGRVAVVGGVDDQGREVTQLELFDPSDERTSLYLASNVAPSEWAQLADGRLLNLSAGQVYDLEVRGAPIATRNRLATPRRQLAVVQLRDGRLVLAGGVSGPAGAEVAHAEVELFDPRSLSFKPLAPLSQARSGALGQLLVDGRVVLVGGLDDRGQPLAELELIDPAGKGATLTLPAPGVAAPRGLALDEGGLLLTGGLSDPGDPASAVAAQRFLPASFERGRGPVRASGIALSGARDYVHPRGAIEVRFSRAIEGASASSATVGLRNVSGRFEPAEVHVSADQRSVVLVPSAPLALGADYRLDLAGLRAEGQALDLQHFVLRTRRQPLLGAGAVLIVRDEGGSFSLRAGADRDGDGSLAGPGELRELFRGQGELIDPVAGLEGAIYVIDRTNKQLLRLADANGDGDAADPGEASVVFARSLSDPCSLAIGPMGELYLADEGSTTGRPDVIWKLVDRNGDGDALDPREAVIYEDTNLAGEVGGLRCDRAGALYHLVLRGSSSAVVRLVDEDGDGLATRAGERTTLINASGLSDLLPAPTMAGWSAEATLVEARRNGKTRFGNANQALAPGGVAAAARGDRVYVAAADGRLWELADRARDGSLDQADDRRELLGAGALTGASSLGVGLRPPAPRVLSAARAGESELQGVAAPGQLVVVTRAAQELSGVCDAQGLFRIPLAPPLSAGEAVEVQSEDHASRSAPLQLKVR